VTKKFHPHVLTGKMIGWWDAEDPYANNGHGLPKDVSATTSNLRVDRWVDKSYTGTDFIQTTTSNMPKFGVGKPTAFSVTTPSSGMYGGVSGSFGNIRTLSITTANPNYSDANAPIVDFTLASGGVLSSINSVQGGVNCTVGDVFRTAYYDGSIFGDQGDRITVTEVSNQGCMDFNASGFMQTELQSNLPTNFRLFICGALSLDEQDTNRNEPFFSIVDQDGTDHLYIWQENDTNNTNGVAVDDTVGKVTYKDSGGNTVNAGTFAVQSTTRDIVEVEVTPAKVSTSQGTSSTLLGTSTAPDLPENYKLQIGGSTGTKLDAFEIILIDETDGQITVDERLGLKKYLNNKWNTIGSSTEVDADLYNNAHKLSPREPLQMVKMYLDECDNVFGVVSGLSTCNATPSTGSECYNTKHTCLNLSKYRVGTNGKKEITFSQEVGRNLAGFEPAAHPALISVTSAPSEIQPTKGVSVRSNITIKLRDFISDDKGIDPYFSTRNIIALENGTFFQKLLARNPHYYGRPIEIYDGFFDFDGTPQVHDGKREYIIESIHLDNDICTIKCKDPMSLADELKSKVPTPTEFSLGETLNTSTHNHINLKYQDIALDGSVQADKDKVTAYFGADNATGFIRINEEILGYRVDVSGNEAALDITSRKDWGTDGNTDAYDVDDSIQKCLSFGTYGNSATGSTIDDVAYEIFVNGAGVSPLAINKTAGGEYSWEDEKTNWLSSFKINTVISEPEQANKLVNQLGSMVGTNFFYDDLAAKIVMRAEMPIINPLTIQTITDVDIVEDSLKIINSEKDRISRVYYYYNRKNGVEDRDKKKSFKNLYVNIDIDSEGTEEYAKQSNKVIYGWGVVDSSTATSISQRILNRFKNVPKTVSFKLDVGSKQIATGEHFYLQTKSIVNLDGGMTARTEMQCIYSKFNDKLQVYEIKAQQFKFSDANFGQITVNVLSIHVAGSNYAENDTMTFTSGSNGATGLTCKVTSVDVSGGVTGIAITAIGDLNTPNKYLISNTLTENGGTNSGTGCLVRIFREYFLGEGAGTGTVEDPYTGARATESYICDDDLQMSDGSEPYRIV